jgi:hypothetical protein
MTAQKALGREPELAPALVARLAGLGLLAIPGPCELSASDQTVNNRE